MICVICNILERCVTEWGLDLRDLYTLTGWDLYDLHELHIFRRENQRTNNRIKLKNELKDTAMHIHEQRN